MDPATILSGFGGLIGSFVNAGTAADINYDQIQLAKYGYEQQREMIREQNEYNSPLQQMKRYEEAGLNPNLIYGNGSSSAGNQSEIARYQAPKLNVPEIDVSRAIETALHSLVTTAQVEKLKNDSFASEQLGMKYQQDAQSQYMNNLFQATILGIQPGVIYDPNDLTKIKGSLKLRGYDATVQGREFQNSLIQSTQSLQKANARLVNMKADAQDYWNKNIQPLVQDIMEKKSAGLSIQNDLLNLQKSFYKADKFFHYGEAILHDILYGINVFKSPISVPQSPSPSWYGSPFYPSESYAPGLE